MFNWDEFRNEKVAVNCDTEEKAREFVEECHKRDMKWEKCTENQTMFDWYKNDTCYNFETDENENRLMFCDKPYYERKNYKIIKWESEKMKFKVGDKVRVINNGLTFNTHSMANEWLREIENPKPYDYGNLPKNGFVGIVRGIVKAPSYEIPTLIIEIGSYSYLILESGVELIDPQTEFTFQEVIARIKVGETYQSIYYASNIQEITKNKKGKILLNLSPCRHIKDEVHIISEIKFKLQEPKKQVNIYRVEHGKGRKQYEFIRKIDNQLILVNDIVECDTKYGRCYGKCVNIIPKELTEEEYKQYKECWRA